MGLDTARHATLPVRLFLGATFLYAALDKLGDPVFLDPSGAGSLTGQLTGVAPRSPLRPLLEALAIPNARLAGAAVIAAEAGIGLALLAGVLVRAAALGGVILNLTFLLTITWDTRPYYIGADGIFAVAGISVAIAGHQDAFTLAPAIRRALAMGIDFDAGRRLALAEVLTAAAAVTWAVSVWPRPPRPARAANAARTAPLPTVAPSSPTPPVATMAALEAAGGGLITLDPQLGHEVALVDVGRGRVVAFDALCTHAGCLVDFDPATRQLVCPCHDSRFDPSRGAAVLGGPAPSPLDEVTVRVDGDAIYLG